MKKMMQLGLVCMLGLISMFTVANEKASPTNKQSTQVSETAELKNRAENVHLLNINTASAAEIQDKLVGVGAKKAQAIVEYREKYGKFLTLEQITEVSGIGKATLEKNRDRIRLE